MSYYLEPDSHITDKVKVNTTLTYQIMQPKNN